MSEIKPEEKSAAQPQAQPKSALLVLRAETPLHAGAGSGAGEIDLPVQRETHTGWPVVWSSSVKGALRERAEQWADGDAAKCAQVIAAFGKEGRGADEHASALATGEATLLLLPVRSLATHFKWVTCDAAIKRLKRVCERIGVPCLVVAPTLANEDTACWSGNPAGALFLEEFSFTPDAAPIAPLARALSSVTGIGEPELLARLVVVHDDRFRWFAEHATPKAAHVALDNDTKTNSGGALWYEETLAPDTVLYAPLTAEASRAKAYPMTAADVLAVATGRVTNPERPYLRVGGNETLGMGWCNVHVAAGAV
jgi:CRISPR-associated protein Cmr4